MKKILLILFLLLVIAIQAMALTYTSVYPTHDADHVKVTTSAGGNWLPYFTTNPALSLTGTWNDNQWVSGANQVTDQRFHIDLGSAEIVRRIYYENGHNAGGNEDTGANNFTFWGSNTEASFLELTYGTDTGWTQITTATSVFIEHPASDEADPHYITATNTTAYQYYAFKFADNHGQGTYMGVRHIALQTEDGYGEAEDNAIFFGMNF